MPTYTLNYSNLILSNKIKKKIALEITNIHKKNTGANTYFAQVLFNKVKKFDHFIGGKKITEKQFFLLGQIRSGRPKKIKMNLIKDLTKMLQKTSKIKKSNIWVYIIDLIPHQMIEYGEFLPISGKEKEWFNKLNKTLKDKLLKIQSK